MNVRTNQEVIPEDLKHKNNAFNSAPKIFSPSQIIDQIIAEQNVANGDDQSVDDFVQRSEVAPIAIFGDSACQTQANLSDMHKINVDV